MSKYIPLAIFPDAQTLARDVNLAQKYPSEYPYVRLFLLSYQHSKDTYNTYRREIERFCQWVWFEEETILCEVDRHLFLHYIEFFKKPPKRWISEKHYPRRLEDMPNPNWRPFVSKGEKVTSEAALKSMLACISTFYTFLMHEQQVLQNPIQMLNQKKQLIKTVKSKKVKRRLSQTQWNYVVDVAKNLADQNPKYERHLYIISLFFLLGLRISEIARIDDADKPMGLFYQDKERRWWFEAHGKGNKQRDVAVADAMVEALSRFRQSIGLVGMPYPGDTVALVPKEKGSGGLGARQIRALVSEVFEHAYQALLKDGHQDESLALKQATVHWLRHTAISEDVLHRPTEDVRDDVGHENIATTSLYIDVMDAKRHASAKSKKLKIEDD